MNQIFDTRYRFRMNLRQFDFLQQVYLANAIARGKCPLPSGPINKLECEMSPLRMRFRSDACNSVCPTMSLKSIGTKIQLILHLGEEFLKNWQRLQIALTGNMQLQKPNLG